MYVQHTLYQCPCVSVLHKFRQSFKRVHMQYMNLYLLTYLKQSRDTAQLNMCLVVSIP